MSDWKKIVDQLKKKDDLTLQAKKYLRPEVEVRPYQVLGAFLLFYCKRFLLADGCGLGKTLQTLLAFAILREREEAKGKEDLTKLVVVTETSALGQWEEEVHKFFEGLTVQVIPAGKKKAPHKSPKDYRKHLYDETDADIYVISHGVFKKDWFDGLLTELVSQSSLVLDEADIVRDQKSIAYKCFKKSSKEARGFKALTATPIYTGLQDYYNLMTIIAPGLFGKEESFLKKYCITRKQKVTTRNGGKMFIDVIEEYKNVELFHYKARHYLILRTPKDVGSELPDLFEKPIYLDMGKKQRKIYERARLGEFNILPGAEEPRKLKGGEYETAEEVEKRLERTQESKLVTQVRQIQVADDPRLVGEKGPSVKMEKLLHLLQGDLYKEHVVVFSQSRECINLIEEELQKVNIESCRVTGSENAKERTAARKAFDKKGPPYVMLITSAGKKAINLQVAGTFVFFDQPLSWGDSTQLVGRIRRKGSDRKSVLVIRLMARDTVDEWVYKILSQEDELVQKCLRVSGTMTISPDLLGYIIDKVKSGSDVPQALESFANDAAR